MASLFFMPFRPAYDGNGKFIPGAQLWFTLTGTNTPITIYTDDGLTTPQANPAVANAIGRWDPIYWDDGSSIRVRTYDADAEVGVDSPIEDYDPYPGVDDVSLLATDLADDAASANGAGMIGYGSGLGYAPGTVGDELDKINTETLGALAAGSVTTVVVDKTGSGHAGGTTDWRPWTNKATYTGANSAVQVSSMNFQTELKHTAGTVAYGYGIQGYVRLGLAGSSTGAVSTMRGVEYHLANEGSGNITDAFTFMDIGVDLADGTGLITTFNSFRSGDHGYTRITGVSYGFYQANCSVATTPITAAYGSEMSYGNLRWHAYYSGGASSWMAGRLRIGGPAPAAQPTDFLEVVGGIRAHTNAGTIGSLGFGTSAGGTVTQATSKSTGVTLNKPCGQITMNNAALAANTLTGFTFANDQIASTDVVNLTIASGVAAGGSYQVWIDAVNNGSCRVIIKNISGGSLSEAVVLNFAVIKAVTA